MQYHVPQFIEVEDKIVGPLTMKQFLYLGGGAGLAYLAYAYLPSWAYFVLSPAFAGFGIALAFVKINGQPFINTLESFARFLSSSRLYVWKKEPKKKAQKKAETTNGGQITLPKLSESRLKDLAWSLDINDVNRTRRQ